MSIKVISSKPNKEGKVEIRIKQLNKHTNFGLSAHISEQEALDFVCSLIKVFAIPNSSIEVIHFPVGANKADCLRNAADRLEILGEEENGPSCPIDSGWEEWKEIEDTEVIYPIEYTIKEGGTFLPWTAGAISIKCLDKVHAKKDIFIAGVLVHSLIFEASAAGRGNYARWDTINGWTTTLEEAKTRWPAGLHGSKKLYNARRKH